MLALYLAMLETPADQQKFLRFYEANAVSYTHLTLPTNREV